MLQLSNDQAYLLRFTRDARAWRVQLEDVHSHKQHNFATVAALIDFIQQQTMATETSQETERFIR